MKQSDLITSDEAAEILGIKRRHANIKLDGLGVRIKNRLFYNLDAVQKLKDEEDSKPRCKSCGGRMKDSINHGFCQKALCRLARSEWVKRNWDQLPEDHNFRVKNEGDFYELNDTQRKKYSYFLSLIRVPKEKKRPCMHCKTVFASCGNRICSECSQSLKKFGALAYDWLLGLFPQLNEKQAYTKKGEVPQVPKDLHRVN